MAKYFYLTEILSSHRCNLVVTMVCNLSKASDRMLQRGVVADCTGFAQFVTWIQHHPENVVILEPGRTYDIQNATSDEWLGNLQLNLNYTHIIEVPDINVDIEDVKHRIPMRWKKLYRQDRRKTRKR